ncbi:MAG: GreA/GreB family elongation factor [Rhodocyclales bacterium]|jgi:regulator of nucleoside diphosphate kinase|nr:GreA/GreB family elongation factor [Rhodocyclales bacterium]MBK9594413.1 GreA/GreB family elongation factor [Rhodocyclales bacterium]CAG0984624.1 Regulator of nucleoside diphosphate kinase [Rhodocyclaceae bacterium]
MNGTIRLTRQDSDRLALMAEALAAQSRGIQKQLRTLDGMMKSALMFEATATPPDVVTIDSRIVIEDLHSGELKQIELVFPEEADPPAGRLSVLSAIGCAVLGHAVGDRVVVETDKGSLPLRIAALVYQPEASLMQG